MDLGINHNIREKSYYIIQNVARLTIYYILGSLALTFIPKVSSSLKLSIPYLNTKDNNVYCV